MEFFICIKASHRLLAGRTFLVLSDHKALMSGKVSASPRVERMKLSLSEYDFTITHIEGDKNTAADQLSRAYALVMGNVVDASDQGVESDRNEEVNAVLGVERKEVVESERVRMIARFHNGYLGHHSIATTLEMMRRNGFEWRNIQNDIAKFVAACPVCQRVKSPKPIRGLGYSLEARDIGDEWCADALHLSKDRYGYQYVLVVICSFSRFVHLIPLKTLTAAECEKRLETLFFQFGIPKRFRTDNGGQFKGQVVIELLLRWGIEPVQIASHNSRENAICERVIREVRTQLAGVLDLRVDTPWSEALPQVQWILNRRTHGVIGLSPAELVFGLSNAFRTPDPTGHLVPFRNRMEVQDIVMEERLIENIQREEDRSEREATDEIGPDSRVMVAQRSNKKNPSYTNWVGPGLVLARSGDRLEVIMNGESKSRQVFIGNVKLVGNEVVLEDKEGGGDHPQEIINISDHEPKSSRKVNILALEMKVQYAQIPEQRWVKAISIRDTEIFRNYAKENGLEYLLKR